MKKFIIIICSLLMTFCTSFNMIANEPENQPQENEIVSIENNISEEDVTPENESTMNEISEQQEKAQERLVLILIIIGIQHKSKSPGFEVPFAFYLLGGGTGLT